MWQRLKTSNLHIHNYVKNYLYLKAYPQWINKKISLLSRTENTITNKFDVVFSYCGNNVKEFILLLPYNKSLEMHELNEQKHPSI